MQGDVLVEIRTDIGIIKHDVAILIQCNKNVKNDYDDLRKDYYDVLKRLAKVEIELTLKKNTIVTWISPMLTPIFTAIILGGIYEMANHLN